MAALSKSKIFASPKLDSRIKSANTQKSEGILGYFVGPMLVYMMYYAIAGTYLTQFYTDVLGLAGGFIIAMPVISKIVDAVTNVIMGRIIDSTRTRQGNQDYTMHVWMQYAEFSLSAIYRIGSYKEKKTKAVDTSRMGY